MYKLDALCCLFTVVSVVGVYPTDSIGEVLQPAYYTILLTYSFHLVSAVPG